MSKRQRCFFAVLLGVAVFVFTRIRGGLAPYVEIHRRLEELGVSANVRNLDAPLLLVLASLAGAWIARSSNPLQSLGLLDSRALGFAASLRQGLKFGLLASTPMLAQAAFACGELQFNWDTAKGTLIAPFVEEAYFRGLFVVIPVSLAGTRFWPVAITSALFFGSLHVPWNSTLEASHFWPFLITTGGGLWYAWIVRIYHWNLWTTIVLHLGMNAAWLVFSVDGGAVGSGLWSNVGRGLTIALGTVMALRFSRSALGRSEQHPT